MFYSSVEFPILSTLKISDLYGSYDYWTNQVGAKVTVTLSVRNLAPPDTYFSVPNKQTIHIKTGMDCKKDVLTYYTLFEKRIPSLDYY